MQSIEVALRFIMVAAVTALGGRLFGFDTGVIPGVLLVIQNVRMQDG